MPSLEARIETLYKLAPDQFVPERNALAKTLDGDAAKVVKALKKPGVVPWTVNQLYWFARQTYDRLTKSGRDVRAAQLAGLEGERVDVRAAVERHRAAVAAAARAAGQLAAQSGLHPEATAVAQMLESLSLAASLPEPPGRFTSVIHPSGFEAFAGVPIKAPSTDKNTTVTERLRRDAARAEARRAEEAQLAAQRKAAAVREAERTVEKAEAVEKRTRAAWERADAALKHAHSAVQRLRDDD